MDLGLYEEAAQLQKPTTDVITTSSDVTKMELSKISNELETLKKTIENQGELTRQQKVIPSNTEESQLPFNKNISPLNKQSNAGNKYVLTKTGHFFTRNEVEYPTWSFTGTKVNYIVILNNAEEEIFNITTREKVPIKLTEGLNELFFNNAQDRSKITSDNISIW